jgi:hypothetical protein
MDQLTLLALLKDLQNRVNSVTKQVGPEGPAGLAGAVGPAGPSGADGIQGERGPAGERGSDGLSGPQGEAGPQGNEGRGVESVSQAADGDLIFTLSDGTEEVIELPYGLQGASQNITRVAVQKIDGNGGGSVVDPDALPTLKNPSFTWVNDLLTRIDYDEGYYKTLTYNVEEYLTVLVLYDSDDAAVQTKTYTYNPDGTLASVAEI